MPELQIIPNPGGSPKLVRDSWTLAGQDDWHEPPGQNPDRFELLENVLPVVNNNLERRWGTAAFAIFAIISRRMFSVFFPTSGRLRLIFTAADGLGTGYGAGGSLNNRVMG